MKSWDDEWKGDAQLKIRKDFSFAALLSFEHQDKEEKKEERTDYFTNQNECVVHRPVTVRAE